MAELWRLAELFAEYGIYPPERYTRDTPLNVFKDMYSGSGYYLKEVRYLLGHQSYRATKRGADLPWWGKNYFNDQEGFRTMIIGPHSMAPDAGSIAFFFNLIGYIENKVDYDRYIDRLDDRWRFSFTSWCNLHQQFGAWGLDMNYAYVTDGAKVYQEDSWTQLDSERSKSLLLSEIEHCNPDLVILLGAAPLELLRDDLTYGKVVESREFITIQNYRAVVSPYPSGNGFSQKNFQSRLDNATHLISLAMK